MGDGAASETMAIWTNFCPLTRSVKFFSSARNFRSWEGGEYKNQEKSPWDDIEDR